MKIALFNWHITPRPTPLGAAPARGLDSAYEGMLNAGYDVVRMPANTRIKVDYVACWGWKRHIAQALVALGRKVIVLELGYIGDRRAHVAIGLNGLNGHAAFPEYPDDGGERFHAHGGVIKPWKKHGDYILILGQVMGDASLQGKDIGGWYKKVADEASRIYGLPVYYRPHPESVRRRGYETLDGYKNIGGTLDDALSGALFTIAYNSNSCLDSVLAGVPCYAGDKGTMAWDLCMRSLNEIVYPEREKVVHAIAWKQWTHDEIRSGKPFERLLQCAP